MQIVTSHPLDYAVTICSAYGSPQSLPPNHPKISWIDLISLKIQQLNQSEGESLCFDSIKTTAGKLRATRAAWSSARVTLNEPSKFSNLKFLNKSIRFQTPEFDGFEWKLSNQKFRFQQANGFWSNTMEILLAGFLLVCLSYNPLDS